MLDTRISALEEDLDEVESSEEEDEEEERVRCGYFSVPGAKLAKMVLPGRCYLTSHIGSISLKEGNLQNPTDGVTVTTIDPAAHRLHATDAAAHPGGAIGLNYTSFVFFFFLQVIHISNKNQNIFLFLF